MAARHRIPELSPEGRAAAEALRRDVAGEVSDHAAAPLALLDRRLRLPRGAGGRARRRRPGRPGRRGGGLGRDRPAGGGARRRLQRRRAGDRPGHRRRLLQARPRPGDRRRTAAGPGSSPASSRRRSTRPRRRYGLEFGPDTSTVDQATIGGMVGNNSSGSRSIVYGESKDKVLRVSAVLAGGEAGRRSAPAPAATSPPASAGRRGRGSRRRSRRCASGTASPSPATSRRRGAAPPATTCASCSPRSPTSAGCWPARRARWRCSPSWRCCSTRGPARRVGAAFTFTTLHAALEANVAILETGPSAVEFLDLEPLRRAPNLAQYRSLAALLDGDGRGAAHRGVPGERGGGAAPASRACARSPASSGAPQMVWLERARGAGRGGGAAPRRPAAAHGRAGRGAPGGVRRGHRGGAGAARRLRRRPAEASSPPTAPAPASPVTRPPGACTCGRCSTSRRRPAWRAWRQLAVEVGRLVADYHGAFSGEHGCGRSRSWFLPRAPRPGLYEAMVAVKDAFDPRRLLNPGVVVGGPPVERVAALRRRLSRRSRLDAAPLLRGRGRLRRRPSRGASAPACARSSTGTMCPPGAATRDEARSTRARANALQGVVCGAVPLAAIGESEFRDVLGTCVACKACKTECPAGVDMAALKVEWLAEVRAREGVPAARARHRRLPPPGRPRRAGRAAGQRARPHPGGAGGDRPRRRGPRAAAAGVRPAAAHAPSARPRPPPAAGGRRRGRALRGLLHPVPGAGRRRGAGAAARRRRRAPRPRRTPAAAAARRCPPGRSRRRAAWRGARSTGCTRSSPAAPRSLFVEPSCLSMVRDDWARLLPHDARVAEVAAASRPALALVADLAAQGRLHFRAGGRALLHSHCHEKALGFAAATRARSGGRARPRGGRPGRRLLRHVRRLRLRGRALRTQRRHGRARPAARRCAPPRPATAVLATGTSCRAQIGDLGGRAAVHPLEFLAGRLEA